MLREIATDREVAERATRLPAWHRITVDFDNGEVPRYLTAHEICILSEVFEDAREKWLRGGTVEELGITLGVLWETEHDDRR